VADWDPLPSLGPSEPKPTRPQCDIIQARLLSSPCLVRSTGISRFLHFSHTARAKKEPQMGLKHNKPFSLTLPPHTKGQQRGNGMTMGVLYGAKLAGLVWPNELPLHTAGALYYRPGHCWTKGKESVWTHGHSFFWK